MTSPPSPPNWRRRRIVVVIAVLVLGLGWWVWRTTRPKIDPRLVGTWTFTIPDFESRWCFFADGTGEVWHRHNKSKYSPQGEGRKFYWQCQNPTLLLLPCMDTGWQQSKVELTRLYKKFRGHPSQDAEFAFAVRDSAVELSALNKEAIKASKLGAKFRLDRAEFVPRLFPSKSTK